MSLRVASAAGGLPLLALAIWFGSPGPDRTPISPLLWLSAVVAFLAAAGALEICQMAGRHRRGAAAQVAAVWSVALVGGAHFIASGYPVQETLPAVVAIWALAFGAWLPRRPAGGIGLVGWGVTLGAALYPGGLLSYAPLLRGLEQGREWVLVAASVTFASDSAAFFVGRRFGRTPLAPEVSPGKTWEGGAGAVLGALGAMAGLAFLLGLDAPLAQLLVLGALMGVVGQLGDLVESRLKRLAGVKDSGRIIPGHGGVLDRVDSIVFNLVLVYYFVVWAVQ